MWMVPIQLTVGKYGRVPMEVVKHIWYDMGESLTQPRNKNVPSFWRTMINSYYLQEFSKEKAMEFRCLPEKRHVRKETLNLHVSVEIMLRASICT